MVCVLWGRFIFGGRNVILLICVKLDGVIDVDVCPVHCCVREYVGLGVDGFVHEANVRKSLVRSLHVSTEDACVDWFAFRVMTMVVAHQVLPICFVGHTNWLCLMLFDWPLLFFEIYRLFLLLCLYLPLFDLILFDLILFDLLVFDFLVFDLLVFDLLVFGLVEASACMVNEWNGSPCI